MAANGSGADELANQLLVSLLAGKEFDFPEVDLGLPIYDQPPESGPDFVDPVPVTIDALTEGKVGGNGVFDRLMTTIRIHLHDELKQGRLAGPEYTKAYLGATGAALTSAIQFLLQKDTSRWQARLFQLQAQAAAIERTKARIELEKARFDFARARYEALTAEVSYALGKIKLASEDVTYANLSRQGAILEIQAVAAQLDVDGKRFGNQYILPLQRQLLSEQVEVQRAQTLDVRTDGTVIVGSVGKQKDLYSQQIVSYKRDSELKVAKLWNDAWITQKTMDEGQLPPDQYTNVQLNALLLQLRSNVGLGG